MSFIVIFKAWAGNFGICSDRWSGTLLKPSFPTRERMLTTHSHPIILLVHPIFGYMISNVLLHLSSLHFPNQPAVLFLGPDLRQWSWNH